MVRWHHRLERYEFEQAPGVDEDREAWCAAVPWGCKELDTTERLD